MDEKSLKSKDDKSGGRRPGTKTPNRGSGAFNQGSEQEPDYKKGVQVPDEEKRTGRPASKPIRQNQNAGKGTRR